MHPAVITSVRLPFGALGRRALTCLGLLCAAVAARAASDSIEGKWLGTAGHAENQSLFGLEIQRDDAGALAAFVWLELLNCYRTPLGTFSVSEDGHYTNRELGLDLVVDGDRLAGTMGAEKKPVTLRRAETLPAEPLPATELPSGPGPRWQTKLGAAIWATAAVRDGVAYVGAVNGVFHAVKLADGSLAWTFSAGRPIFGEAAVEGDAVYFVCDNGFLFKLARDTGKEVWRYDLGDAQVARILPHPSVYDYDHEAPTPVLADGVVYVGSGDGSFHAVDAATGRRVWRIESSGKIRSTAALAGPNLVFTNFAGAIHLIERSSGREIWRKQRPAAFTGSPVVVDGLVIAGDRSAAFMGLKLDSGEEQWRTDWWGSWIESTAAIADGLGYIGASDYRRVTCFEPKDGRTVWRADVFGWAWGMPLVTSDSVYVATGGAEPYFIRQQASVTALDRASGKIKWRWPVAAPDGAFHWGFAAGPAGDGNTFVVGGLDGTLYAFPVE